MSMTSYATSESYQNGIEVKRGEFDGIEMAEGALRLPVSHRSDTVRAVLGVEISRAPRRAA
ncbi:hypothetical protein [Granulicella sibirica]|uniref:Uncharacterized protein n=1 Tax=Granulicella sibirica TaxID=2479048 RepID=A0A4Q0SXD9_9BACT|nr:hypothetical protein [Granulicella sibirica]RXH54640.1 hypothetical protein GRAN_3744 [Granulicella sibirica]